MVMESELERDSLALAPYHSNQVHRKEPQSHTKSKALVTDMVEDEKQETFIGQQERGRI